MTISINNHSLINSKNAAFGNAAGGAACININSKSAANLLKWSHENIASHYQRLILGATALSSQPFIDLNNKKVDERTRQISCAKTIAKIISGTSVGFAVRWACTKIAKTYTCVDANGRKAASNSFLSPSVMKSFSKDRHIQYINSVGAILGIMTCLFTNFLIDAPLTRYLTNKFSDKIDEKYKAKGVKK